MRVFTTLPQENLGHVGAAAQAIEATGYTGVSTQENRHEPFLSLAVAGGEEDGVEPRTRLEEGFLLREEGGFFLGTGQNQLERDPGPVIEIVLLAQLAELRVDQLATVFHQGRRAFVERNALDRVGPENDHIAEVLLELLERPRVVTVGRGPVANLMSADLAIGCKIDREVSGQTDGAAAPFETPQEFARAEHRAPRVVANNQNYSRPFGISG